MDMQQAMKEVDRIEARANGREYPFGVRGMYEFTTAAEYRLDMLKETLYGAEGDDDTPADVLAFIERQIELAREEHAALTGDEPADDEPDDEPAPPSVVELAKQMAAAFEMLKRDNGQQFWTLKDDAPGWMTDIVHAAHTRMPNDAEYDMLRDCVNALAECEPDSDDDDWTDAISEIEPEHRTYALYVYAYEFSGFVDEALSEGDPVTLTESGDLLNLFQRAYAIHTHQIGAALIFALSAMTETE